MLSTITTFIVFCLAVGASQWSYIGGTPIANLLFMLCVISPAIFIILGSIQMTMPILYALLAGGSLFLSLRDIKKVGATTGKFVIDYDLVVLCLPVAATGALFGALMKNFLSDLCICLFSGLLMIYLLYLTCREKKQSDLLTSAQFMLHQELLPIRKRESEKVETELDNFGQPKDKKFRGNEEEFNPELQKILDEEVNRLPKSKLKIMGFVFLYTLAILLTKNASSDELIVINPDIDIPDSFKNETVVGSETPAELVASTINGLESILQGQLGESPDPDPIPSPSPIDPYIDEEKFSSCVVGSFLFLVIHLTLSYLSSKSVAIQTATKDSEKQKYGYVFLREDDKMSSKKMWNCMIAGFVGGFVVGTFGIGASIVLIPVWVGLGVDEETAIHSSGPVTFFASFISMLLFALTGHGVISNYILLFFFVLGLLCTVLVNWAIKKLGLDYNPKRLMLKIRVIMYASSIGGLVLYGFPAYLISRHFSQFGFFC